MPYGVWYFVGLTTSCDRICSQILGVEVWESSVEVEAEWHMSCTTKIRVHGFGYGASKCCSGSALHIALRPYVRPNVHVHVTYTTCIGRLEMKGTIMGPEKDTLSEMQNGKDSPSYDISPGIQCWFGSDTNTCITHVAAV